MIARVLLLATLAGQPSVPKERAHEAPAPSGYCPHVDHVISQLMNRFGVGDLQELRERLEVDPLAGSRSDSWVFGWIGDFPSQAIDSRQMLKRNSSDLEATLNLGVMLQAIGSDDEAMEVLETAPKTVRILDRRVSNKYPPGLVHAERCRILLRRDRLDEAREACQLGIDGGSVGQANILMARINLLKGDAAAADRHIKAAIASKPSRGHPHFTASLVARSRGEVQAAKQLLVTTLDLDPAFAPAREMFSVDRPVKEWLAIEQREDRRGIAMKLVRCGHIYLAVGNQKRADACLDAAERLEPGSAAAARLEHLAESDPAKALDGVEALVKGPHHDSADVLHARLLLDRRDAKAARAVVERAVERRPGSVELARIRLEACTALADEACASASIRQIYGTAASAPPGTYKAISKDLLVPFDRDVKRGLELMANGGTACPWTHDDVWSGFGVRNFPISIAMVVNRSIAPRFLLNTVPMYVRLHDPAARLLLEAQALACGVHRGALGADAALEMTRRFRKLSALAPSFEPTVAAVLLAPVPETIEAEKLVLEIVERMPDPTRLVRALPILRHEDLARWREPLLAWMLSRKELRDAAVRELVESQVAELPLALHVLEELGSKRGDVGSEAYARLAGRVLLSIAWGSPSLVLEIFDGLPPDVRARLTSPKPAREAAGGRRKDDSKPIPELPALRAELAAALALAGRAEEARSLAADLVSEKTPEACVDALRNEVLRGLLDGRKETKDVAWKYLHCSRRLGVGFQLLVAARLDESGRREMARFVGIAEQLGDKPTDTGEPHPWWKFVARSEERLWKAHGRDLVSLRALLLQTETPGEDAK